MANSSSNPAPKPYRQNQSKQGGVKRISKKLKKKPNRKSWLISAIALTVLMGSGALVVTFAWISIQFILNPYQVGWLNKFLPDWAQFSTTGEERPHTLKQIQGSLKEQGLEAGKILPLKGDTTSSFLLPVLKKHSNCQSDCQSIVELRVYQISKELEVKSDSEKYYRLASQLPVVGPEESFVIAPFAKPTEEDRGSSLPLPLNTVGRVDGNTPSSGVWFYLRGDRQEGTSSIAYGTVVYYNSDRSLLQFMLPWTSPNGHLPEWRQVTGGGSKELVVDRTVGLEPQLKIYQAQRVKYFLNPIQLEEISFKQPTLKHSVYRDALLLARSGLWTPALERLESLKKRQKKLFSPLVQSQMDAIRLHSQITKNQATTIWASPSQEVLADIIDGRWEKALQVFKASPQNAQEVSSLLKADGERIWRRVETELQVNPKRQSVQAWGALIVAARHGKERANTWLNQHSPITEDTITYARGLIELLDGKAQCEQSNAESCEYNTDF
jgi:hypothetical protein